MSPPRGTCHFCHQPVAEFETAAFPVKGWESERGGLGGTNHVALRQRIPNHIAHARCVEERSKLKRKGLIGQESLL